jgi:hypothetical protein
LLRHTCISANKGVIKIQYMYVAYILESYMSWSIHSTCTYMYNIIIYLK